MKTRCVRNRRWNKVSNHSYYYFAKLDVTTHCETILGLNGAA